MRRVVVEVPSLKLPYLVSPMRVLEPDSPVESE
jgi:hypothetical protein